jgi:hypothetical protein
MGQLLERLVQELFPVECIPQGLLQRHKMQLRVNHFRSRRHTLKLTPYQHLLLQSVLWVISVTLLLTLLEVQDH